MIVNIETTIASSNQTFWDSEKDEVSMKLNKFYCDQRVAITEYCADSDSDNEGKILYFQLLQAGVGGITSSSSTGPDDRELP